jgi:hypothetical protein
MRTLLRLLIVVVILNATARAAMTAWRYYEFKDLTYQTILFGARATDGQLQAEILRRAQELELPVEPQNVQVTRDGFRTRATASYTQPVELFPRYEYPVDLSFTVEAIGLDALPAER